MGQDMHRPEGEVQHLTKEEHTARAMLLGMSYRPHFHAYRREDNSLAGYYIDADTLEPLDYAVLLSRINATMPSTQAPYPETNSSSFVRWIEAHESLKAKRRKG